MVALNLPQELPYRRRDIRVFAMEIDDAPVAVFIRVLPGKLQRQVKGKLARLSRKIEAAAEPVQADRYANKFGALVQKAVVEQCLGAASITSLTTDDDVIAEVPSDLDAAHPVRLSVEQIGILLAALDLAP
ncbi:hypothetical protein AB1K70_19180 [Bremerella sp. JC770]|uniref:hypothetical protein n=1 Tax=Bremerella sp. JC770 TaxID=3232137 RepID=UPI003459C04B